MPFFLDPVTFGEFRAEEIVYVLLNLDIVGCSSITLIIQGNEDRLSRMLIEPVVETKEHVLQLGCGSKEGLGLMFGQCWGL